MPIRATNCHSCVMEPDVPAYKEYEKLRYVPDSTESTYYTIDHTLIDDQIMESMKNCSTFVETLHGLENALKSVEKEISVLLSKKETLFSNELKGARTTHLGDKLKGKDSHKDKDITIVNYVQMLQSVENEVRIFEEKRKCLLGRKEILLREELAKTTESEK
ncbi:hypothetical protein ACJMK2_032221 [Sinanodonta woodiana]|uniref:Uncharacterized protein n=1 Tax=Sinanodonta woodiana TaxID=1069815 RepID=A0ABD3X2I6_SINWO